MRDDVLHVSFYAKGEKCLRGGMKESGIGRENGNEAFEACKSSYSIKIKVKGLISLPDSQSKSTIINIASPEETRQTDDWFSNVVEGQRYG